MEQLGLHNIFRVYRRHLTDSGEVKNRLIGRYLLFNNELHILEDHGGMLSAMLHEGPIDEQTQKGIDSLKHSAHTEVVTEGDVHEGHHLAMIPEQDLGEPEQPAAFEANNDVEIGGDGPGDDLIERAGPSAEPPEPERPKPVFWYLRRGYSTPLVLEMIGERMYLNGKVLDQDKKDQVLSNIRSGVATIRYKE